MIFFCFWFVLNALFKWLNLLCLHSYQCMSITILSLLTLHPFACFSIKSFLRSANYIHCYVVWCFISTYTETAFYVLCFFFKLCLYVICSYVHILSRFLLHWGRTEKIQTIVLYILYTRNLWLIITWLTTLDIRDTVDGDSNNASYSPRSVNTGL